jgi:two-component system uhpT operon response regulator UhpA
VLLVDDHPLFLAALTQLITREPDLVVVGTAPDAATALDIVETIPVDLAILDVLLPDASGISLASKLTERRPSTRVLGLSAVHEPTIIASMLRSGALGFVMKTQGAEQFMGALRTVLDGQRDMPPSVAPGVGAAGGRDPSSSIARMTPREREVFDLLIRGHSNDEIAARLHISRRTVETHRQHISRKLAAHSIVDLLRVAARQGLLTD